MILHVPAARYRFHSPTVRQGLSLSGRVEGSVLQVREATLRIIQPWSMSLCFADAS